MADAEFVAAGQVIRIRTTGGGGWGDPLERPYDEVVRDVAWGKVSVDGARDSYAVLLHRDGDDVVLDEPVAAGEVIRIRTTGGGGWGNPLERDPALVVRDVVWRKVSPEAALASYGVVLTGSLDDDSLGFDADATAAERASRPAASDAFFDRGPGYATLSGGRQHASVDMGA